MSAPELAPFLTALAGAVVAGLSLAPPARAQATWDAAAPCAATPAASAAARGASTANPCGGALALGSGGRYVERRLAALQADGFGGPPVGGVDHTGLPGADVSAAGLGAGVAPAATAVGANTPAWAGWQLLAGAEELGTGRGAVDASSSWWLLSAYAGGGNASKGVEVTGDAVRALAVPGNVCSTLRSGPQSGKNTFNASTTDLCNTAASDNAVPAPGTLALLGAALLAALAARRRHPGPPSRP